MENNSKEESKFKCKPCGKCYESESAASNHVRKEHGRDDKNFKNNKCKNIL